MRVRSTHLLRADVLTHSLAQNILWPITNFINLSLSEAASCSDIKKFSSILRKSKVHYCYQKSSPLVPILSEINPINTAYIIIKRNLIWHVHGGEGYAVGWLRQYATSGKVAGSIPNVILFLLIYSLQPQYGPGFDSFSDRSEYQDSSWG
jgi:hypothetical protein